MVAIGEIHSEGLEKVPTKSSPTAGEVYFESELPPDFKAVVEKWEGYTTARPYIESDEE